MPQGRARQKSEAPAAPRAPPRPFEAIGAGLKDVFLGRLTALALINLLIAGVLVGGGAWAAVTQLPPLIPDGEGWVRYFSRAGEWVAGIGGVIVAAALSPGISMMVGGWLFDIAAERVERAIGAPGARRVGLIEGVWNGFRIAIPAFFLNLIALPFYFTPVFGAVLFFSLNGYLMGREYSTLAAARRMKFRDAKKLRRTARISVFLCGIACSLIPFLAPLVAASVMTRLVNQLCARNGTT
ncbi:MAG: EI24 domain-containing protein [Hyphomonadaceae bacterium]